MTCDIPRRRVMSDTGERRCRWGRGEMSGCREGAGICRWEEECMTKEAEKVTKGKRGCAWPALVTGPPDESCIPGADIATESTENTTKRKVQHRHGVAWHRAVARFRFEHPRTGDTRPPLGRTPKLERTENLPADFTRANSPSPHR